MVAKGKHHSEETRQRMSESHKNKQVSEETRSKMSDAWTPERRQKMSEVHKNKQVSEETRKKRSENMKNDPKAIEHCRKMAESNKGKHHSEETRRKISESNKGKHLSEETRSKMSDAWTPERRQKMSEVHKNKQVSEETRKKMSESAKSGWVKRKGLESQPETETKNKDQFYATYYISVFKPEIKAYRTQKVRAKLLDVGKGIAVVIDAVIVGQPNDAESKAAEEEIGKMKIISRLIKEEA